MQPTTLRTPKIFHITHVENLAGVVNRGLWSDSERLRQGFDCTVVGMAEIKRRRLEELVVDCHPGTRVGDYVPFYLCPRSVMLYILHRGNSPGLTYAGGQEPIVHLQADLHAVVEWANNTRRRWAFTKGNAGARYAEFFDDLRRLGELDWNAIAATDWRDPDTKERKQAEFLVERSLPWDLVECIGVMSESVSQQVKSVVRLLQRPPSVVVKPDWYY